jgi:hypothetical protein
MQNDKSNQQKKQNADRDNAPAEVEQDGFTAHEIGTASAYEDATEIAQRMRRGDETKGDPNDRDTVGTVGSDKVSEEISADKEKSRGK